LSIQIAGCRGEIASRILYGGVRMSNASEYQKRAEECIRKAETAPKPADRAGWLKLAADWIALSRIRFQQITDPLEREHSI
jgi:hypothetical protein